MMVNFHQFYFHFSLMDLEGKCLTELELYFVTCIGASMNTRNMTTFCIGLMFVLLNLPWMNKFCFPNLPAVTFKYVMVCLMFWGKVYDVYYHICFYIM